MHTIKSIVSKVRETVGALAAAMVEAELSPKLGLRPILPSHRKHPHLPQFTKLSGGERSPRHVKKPVARRGHGLGRHVNSTPATTRSAALNARDYMHSAARRRFEADAARLGLAA